VRLEPPTHGLGLNFWLGADLEIEIGSDGTAMIPDAALLFNADFRKAGKDLLIVGEDGRRAIVHDYFADEKRATLMSREGASVLGSIVDAIVRQTTPAEYAQAGGQAPSATPIGRVEKVTGSAIAIRNGVPVALNVGDVVYQGDVVQTRAASSLGIGFIDGTAFNLSANARMVLNEMVYDPNGTANSSVVSLVQGTISFVAGQVAKTGDMQVQTPVATMGIRGTIVIVEISANNGPTKISSVFDPNTGRVGEIVAWENGNRSNVLATIASEDRAVLFTPQLNQQPIVTEIPRTAADQLAAQNVVQQVLAIQTAFNAQPFQAGQQYTPPPSDPGTGPSGPATGGGAGGSSSAPTDNLATQGGTQATTLVGSLTPPPPPDPNIPQNATFAATTLTGGSSGGGTGGSATQNGSSGPPPDSVASHSPNGGSGSTRRCDRRADLHRPRQRRHAHRELDAQRERARLDEKRSPDRTSYSGCHAVRAGGRILGRYRDGCVGREFRRHSLAVFAAFWPHGVPWRRRHADRPVSGARNGQRRQHLGPNRVDPSYRDQRRTDRCAGLNFAPPVVRAGRNHRRS
jgi:FecR protein